MTQKLHKKALVLSYITVAYNIIEGIVSIIAGSIAGSAALVGFGLDSFVESLSGSIMIWRFRQHSKISQEEEERIEKKAVKLIAYTFFILAAYVFYESATKLFNSEIPQPSIIGIIIAVISIIAMPVLFFMKYRTGKSLNSKSLVADSKQTLACLFLSVALLFGLSLNYLYGFWQADPVVGLLISGYLVKEGYSTIREEELCSC